MRKILPGQDADEKPATALCEHNHDNPPALPAASAQMRACHTVHSDGKLAYGYVGSQSLTDTMPAYPEAAAA